MYMVHLMFSFVVFFFFFFLWGGGGGAWGKRVWSHRCSKSAPLLSAVVGS